MENKLQENILELLKTASKDTLADLLAFIQNELGVSDHFKWAVEWVVEKFENENSLIPYATIATEKNIITDNGAEALLKILCGISGVTDFSSSNAYLFVGSDNTAENAAQTGVIASLGSSGMISGYPQMSGKRSVIFKATFGETDALGSWKEMSVANASGSSAVSLNRKVYDMGTKVSGVWTLQATITLLSV